MAEEIRPGPSLSGGSVPRLASQILMSAYDTTAQGGDSTADFIAVMAAAFVVAKQYGKCQVILDSKSHYYLKTAAVLGAHGEYAQVAIPWYPFAFVGGSPAVWIEFVGMPGGNGFELLNGAGVTGTIIESTIATHVAFDGAKGVPSMIGGPASYGGVRGGGTGSTTVCMSFKDLTLVQPDDPPYSFIDLGWTLACDLDRVNCVTLDFIDGTAITAITGATSVNAIGVVFPFVNCQPPVRAGTVNVAGAAVGFILGEALVADFLQANWCALAVGLDVSFWPNVIGMLWDINCIDGISGYNPGGPTIFESARGTGRGSGATTPQGLSAGVVIDAWNIQPNNNQTPGFNRFADVIDDNSLLPLQAQYAKVRAGTGVGDGTVIFNSGGGLRTRIQFAQGAAGVVTAPSVPASNTVLQNPYARDAMVNVIGGTVTAVKINGVTLTGVTSGMVLLPAGATITLTYSAAPSWQWLSF